MEVGALAFDDGAGPGGVLAGEEGGPVGGGEKYGMARLPLA